MKRQSKTSQKLVLGALFMLTCAAGSQAAAPNAAHPELASLDAILDANRWLAMDIAAHPELLQSTAFLGVHPDLRNYLQSHATVLQELVANPGLLQAREQRFFAAGIGQADATGNRVKRTSLDWLDSYLESQPKLEEALRSRPSSIDAPDTLKQYPALAAALKKDPALVLQFKAHPGAFLNR